MLELRVPDMTCGHCAQTIEKAVKSIDPEAQVEVDLARKSVSVATTAPEQTISEVLRLAGYDNEKLGV